MRQLDIVTPEQLDFPIWIIGAGGIGSWSTLALAKMGCQDITVFDFDVIEEKNTPGQFYSLQEENKKKVAILQKKIKEETGILIKVVDDRFYNAVPEEMAKVIVCGVDSLEERRKIWDKLVENIPLNFDLFIDARMAGDDIRILMTSPLNRHSLNSYHRSLNPNKKPYEAPCTARSVVYNVFLCAGLISNIIKKYAKKDEVPLHINLDIQNVQFI